MTEYRIAVVGGGGVGKSALTIQFVQNIFVEDYDPTIEDSYRKQISIPDSAGGSTVCLVDILDTAGQEEYSSMRDRYLRSSQGMLIVYDITRRSSFDDVETLIHQVYRVHDRDEFPIILVANKLDLADSRVVSSAEGIEMAEKYNIPYAEVSVKLNKHVEQVFHDIVRTIQADKNSSRQTVRRNKRGLFSKKQKTADKTPTTILGPVPKSRLFNGDAFYEDLPVVDIPKSSHVRDLKEMLSELNFSDIEFQASDIPTPIQAHKFMLVTRCGKMRTLIENHVKAGNVEPIPVPCTAVTFQQFLEFIYSNSISIPQDNEVESKEAILQLFALAVEWQMADLCDHILQQYSLLNGLIVKEFPEIPIDKNEKLQSTPKFYRDLRRALIASGSDYKTFNVKFNIIDEPGKSILAHKAILIQRSAYFRAMFTVGTKECNEYEINITEVSQLSLLASIEYCYTDDVKYMDDNICVDLLRTANKLLIGRLKVKVEAYIAKGLSWENLIRVYLLAAETNSDSLIKCCSLFFVRLWDKIKTHKDFSLLSKEEINNFKSQRNILAGKYSQNDLNELENTWFEKLEGNTKTDETVVSPENEKKCIVM